MRALLTPILFLVSVAPVDAAGPQPAYTRASLIERPVFAVARVGREVDSGGPPEVRGFFGPADAPEVSLRSPGTGRGCWVRVGDSFDGWVVESADADSGRVILGSSGARLTLALMKESLVVFSRSGVSGPGEADEAGRPGRQRLGDGNRKVLLEGMAELRATHPEYFRPDATPDQIQALAKAGARIRESARRISVGERE